jgi:leucyl/phenylalanyl-tRNA---protein transferase
MDRAQTPDDRPVYLLDERPLFPPPGRARGDGLLAVGGDLSVPRLLEAYRNGIFPWYEEGEPILWWSPDPRLVLVPDEFRASRSLRAVIRKGTYDVSFDTAFARVVRACAKTPRKHEDGTWITPEVESSYTALHEMGYAHSVETWFRGELVGGLYGVHLGLCFFGESMFSAKADASKVALAALVDHLRSRGTHLIDCQVTSEHLLSLGAREIPRAEFLRLLRDALRHPTSRGRWTRTSAQESVY